MDQSDIKLLRDPAGVGKQVITFAYLGSYEANSPSSEAQSQCRAQSCASCFVNSKILGQFYHRTISDKSFRPDLQVCSSYPLLPLSFRVCVSS